MSLTPEETWGSSSSKEPQEQREPKQPTQSSTPTQSAPASKPSGAPSFTPYPSPTQEPGSMLKNVASWTQSIFIIFLLCMILALLTWNTFRPATKWEYKIEAIPDLTFETSMTRLGEEGWELVFARRASSNTDLGANAEFSYEVIFKRPAK